MRNLIALGVMAVAAASAQSISLSDILPGTQEEELAQVKSPDGRSTAILIHKHRHGWFWPTEGSKTLERWARLKVVKGGRTIYDSGDEPLNLYEMDPQFALDLMWSPDSAHLAYRFIETLRTIGADGKATSYRLIPEDAIVSSFRWIDNESLLVVSKKGGYRLDMYGRPYRYPGYTEQAKDTRISRLHLTKGQMELYSQAVNNPTFLFHALKFGLEEISPRSDRVAFSDGVRIRVYDDAAGKVIAEGKIPQAPPNVPAESPLAEAYRQGGDTKSAAEAMRLEREWAARPSQLFGIWWHTNSRLVLRVVPPNGEPTFYTFDIPSQKIADVSKALQPLWRVPSNSPADGGYRDGWSDPNWYRVGLK